MFLIEQKAVREFNASYLRLFAGMPFLHLLAYAIIPTFVKQIWE